MATEIELTVNGEKVTVDADPQTPLLYILRNDLGLKGAKYACGLEQCGACKVLIDGVAVPSCHTAVGSLTNSEIVTIEGLGTPEDLHPLQEAFIEEQATQCGYCTAGLIMAAQGLLNQHRYPTAAQIDEALDSNLCRCGTHERVRRAIKLRIARPEAAPLYEIQEKESLPAEHMFPQILVDYPNLDSWIRIDPTETITVFSGKVEYGQGLKTALSQIAADELDVDQKRIQMVMGDSERSPNEGMTVGSMSLQTSGNAIRQAAAEARYVLLQIALEELEAHPQDIIIKDGQIINSATGVATDYWRLFGGKPFNHQIKGIAQPKAADAYGLVGTNATRVDLLPKVTGTLPYVQDLQLADMVHARIVRPPTYQSRLLAVDTAVVQQMPGVLKLVQDGSFLGVIAEREEEAINGMEKLAAVATWEHKPLPAAQDALYAELEAQIDESYLVVDGTATDDPIPPIKTPEQAVTTIQATYKKPYHMHATIGPSSALAYMQEDKLTIWGHSQGAYPPRDNIAKVLGMSPERIHFIHVEGSGCYGHNGSDDAALDAALLAAAFPNRPILLKWTRANEHQWEPYSPATVSKMEASLDAQGNVLDWNHDLYSPPHLGRARADEVTSGLLGAWYLARPMPKPPLRPGMWKNGGSHRNADPLYPFKQKRIVKHVQLQPPVRVSSFRGLGAFANIFAIESFMDELAVAANIDPVAFRLQNLKDKRAIAVIEAAATKGNWGAPMPQNWGRGIAFAQYKNSAAYCAVVVEVHVDVQRKAIDLKLATIVGEAGQTVNPDGLSNQLEGGFIQAASMSLKEQVQYEPDGILSADWETYPIAAFHEIPQLQTVILNRPGMPFLGGGEASIGPTPAAIANAVFDATGRRLRTIPFQAEIEKG